MEAIVCKWNFCILWWWMPIFFSKFYSIKMLLLFLIKVYHNEHLQMNWTLHNFSLQKTLPECRPFLSPSTDSCLVLFGTTGPNVGLKLSRHWVFFFFFFHSISRVSEEGLKCCLPCTMVVCHLNNVPCPLPFELVDVFKNVSCFGLIMHPFCRFSFHPCQI